MRKSLFLTARTQGWSQNWARPNPDEPEHPIQLNRINQAITQEFQGTKKSKYSRFGNKHNISLKIYLIYLEDKAMYHLNKCNKIVKYVMRKHF